MTAADRSAASTSMSRRASRRANRPVLHPTSSTVRQPRGNCQQSRQSAREVTDGIARMLDLEDAMCFDRDARPPLPPVAGAAAEQGDLVLTAADGNRLAAYFARAADPTGAGIVIMPDVRGLHAFYKELAQRFAEAGVDAVAIDYFGRTAGTGPRGHDFDYPTHVRQTTVEGVTADAGAGVAHLRSPQGGGARAVFTVGFCFGGGRSWRQAAAGRRMLDFIARHTPARV